MWVPAVLAAAGGTVGRVCAETDDSQRFLHTPGDPAVSAIAERQDGAISVEQLRDLGLGEGAIRHRVARARLHRFHHGVYAVGHPRLTPRGRLWAAVLSCGGSGAAVLSHRSAAAVWDLLPSPREVRRHDTPRRPLHADRPRPPTRTLRPDDTTHDDGLPITTVARTLIDLATTLSPQRLERIVHQAEHLRLLDTNSLNEQFARAHGRRTKSLRQALQTLAIHDPDITRSKLEERFLALIFDAGLPRPQTNAMVGPHEVDFLWPEHRLIVETDGAATHLTPQAFEDDRRRGAQLTALGYRVVRFTWRQVVEQPRATIATLAVLLAYDG